MPVIDDIGVYQKRRVLYIVLSALSLILFARLVELQLIYRDVYGQQAEENSIRVILSTGQADMVALARAMMLNPRWAWQAGQSLHADAPLPPNYARAHPKNWPQAFEKKAAE